MSLPHSVADDSVRHSFAWATMYRRQDSREDFLAFEVFLSRSSVHSHPCPSYDLSATITLQLSAGANLSSSMVQAHDRDPSGLRLHWMDADWWNKTMNHS